MNSTPSSSISGCSLPCAVWLPSCASRSLARSHPRGQARATLAKPRSIARALLNYQMLATVSFFFFGAVAEQPHSPANSVKPPPSNSSHCQRRLILARRLHPVAPSLPGGVVRAPKFHHGRLPSPPRAPLPWPHHSGEPLDLLFVALASP
jgi:hypothetical protein